MGGPSNLQLAGKVATEMGSMEDLQTLNIFSRVHALTRSVKLVP
jgi:hypothetical protein